MSPPSEDGDGRFSEGWCYNITMHGDLTGYGVHDLVIMDFDTCSAIAMFTFQMPLLMSK